MDAITIVNNSLAIMGVDPIMAFTEDSKTAKYVNLIYERVRNYVLSLHNWNFALKRVKLPTLTDNEQSDLWTYAYQEPSDVLKIESVRTKGDKMLYKYEEIGNVIYANETEVYLRYVYPSIETLYPIYFCNVLMYRLAMDLSVPILRDVNFFKTYETLFQMALKEARGLDSIRGKKRKISNTEWLKGLENDA